MTATTRLKMRVWSVTDYPEVGPKTGENITLEAVYEEAGGVNATWSKYTPSGRLTYSVTNENVWGAIKPGEYYFVDLTQTTQDG